MREQSHGIFYSPLDCVGTKGWTQPSRMRALFYVHYLQPPIKRVFVRASVALFILRRDYFRRPRKVETAVPTRFIKVHEIVESAPDAPVSSGCYLGPYGAPFIIIHASHVVIDLPVVYVIRLVKVDVQELFERRKVSECCRCDGSRHKVRTWQPPWRKSQGAPRVQISERGYSFDEIKWKSTTYFWVHLVFLGSYDFKSMS